VTETDDQSRVACIADGPSPKEFPNPVPLAGSPSLAPRRTWPHSRRPRSGSRSRSLLHGGEGLVEEGHNLLLGGKTKVSKTTLTVDLARALTNDEERWLDEFALSPPTGQVGWINCEMTEAHFRRWLRSAGVNPSRLSVLDLRGNVPNFLDPDWWRKSATGWSPRTFPSWSWTRSGLSAPC
jgi:hypothetical protein